MENNTAPEESYLDDDEPAMPDTCPNCNRLYDSIDYEYQICHHCNWINNNTNPHDIDLDEEAEDNNPNDSRNL